MQVSRDGHTSHARNPLTTRAGLVKGRMSGVFHVMFYEPRIPPNTGAAIRMSAVTGTTLHLVEPLGFDLSDAKLRRAGLDYHDLAHVIVHTDFDAAMAWVSGHANGTVYAFTSAGRTMYADLAYCPGDTLLFGPEPTGLPDQVTRDARITDTVRIPMRPGLRSLNLSNAAAIATYEAWGQHGYAGA